MTDIFLISSNKMLSNAFELSASSVKLTVYTTSEANCAYLIKDLTPKVVLIDGLEILSKEVQDYLKETQIPVAGLDLEGDFPINLIQNHSKPIDTIEILKEIQNSLL